MENISSGFSTCTSPAVSVGSSSSPCCFHPVGNALLRRCSLIDETASSPPAVRACLVLLSADISDVEMPLIASAPLLPLAVSDDGPATAGPPALRAAAATTPAPRVRMVRHKQLRSDAMVKIVSSVQRRGN